MSNKHFSRIPNINLPRTKMKQNFTHTTSFNFGKLIPIDCFEVLPGDTYNCKLSSLIRMTQPITDFMDTLDCEIHAFFVPMRLVYKHTQEFFGENKDSAGYQKTEFHIPMDLIGNDYDYNNVVNDSPSAYLGKPITAEAFFDSGLKSRDYQGISDSPNYWASILKERAYWLIWSEWYRAQQLQDPFVMLDSDDDYEDVEDFSKSRSLVGHIGNNVITLDLPCANVCKKFDYFTSSTLSPQYGQEVLLPLGDTADVVADGVLELYGAKDNEVAQGDTNYLSIAYNNPAGTGTKDGYGWIVDAAEDSLTKYKSGLKVDLSKATAASVNQVRYAFQVQRYLERANFGSRYFEVLSSHFGVSSPDARLQRPEYLGGQKFFIAKQQVLSTTGATDDENTKLGKVGANSITQHSDYLFTKGFVEHGFVMIMVSTRQHDHKYCQGLNREDSREIIFDYYFPEFANLGDQEVKNKEIFIDHANYDQGEGTFGYQEHWAEYRYRKNLVSGNLNPTLTNPEDYWTLVDHFANLPVLGKQFIEENRENIKRVLVNGDDCYSVNDFIADFYFEYEATRVMPAYTIPGLIDHVGGR